MYIIDCDIDGGTANPGIFVHNTLANTEACQLYVLNSISFGTQGLDVQCEGSASNGDIVSLINVEIIGTSVDLLTRNGVGGFGEINVALSNVTYQTSTLVNSAKVFTTTPILEIPFLPTFKRQ